MTMKKVGIALGGGGVRGLAHLLALETLDECGVKPSVIAGTSMGAIVGVLYASGKSPADIRQSIEKHMLAGKNRFKEALARKSELLQWLKMVKLERGRGGLLQADAFLHFLLKEIHVFSFEELRIPCRVIATDFWTGHEVVFESGPLLPALKASIAVPGVFAPVVLGRQTLVDGGLSNTLPYDRLTGCDFCIAIDAIVSRQPKGNATPGILESVLGMYDILMENNTALKIALSPPSLYIRPEIHDVPLLDFSRIADVLQQSRPAMEFLKAEIERAHLAG
jgi:NTE family protein